MNKAEFIARVAEVAGTTKKDATLAVNAALYTITETLAKGESVALVGFGSFNVKDRAARMSTIPGSTRVVEVPAKKAVSFKVGKDLKTAANA